VSTTEAREAWRTMTGPQYQEFLESLMAEPARLKVRSAAEFLGDDSIAEDPFEIPAIVEHISSSPFRVIEAGEFAGGAYVEPDWLIEELIPARGIGLAWGLSGSDKTGGVFDLMAATHRGVCWRDKAVKRGRSVMVVGEGEFFFGNRLRAYALDRGIDVAELPAVVPSAINLRDSKQVAAFALELLKLGAAQVWFDTLQQCSPGADENSVKDMGEVITNLKFLSRKIGGFCGVIHHAGKSIDKGARGSSAWRPAVDVELYFESDGTRGTMRCEKLKDGPPNTVYPFERRIVQLGARKNGKPISSVCVVQSDTAPVARAKGPGHGTDARNAYDIAKAAITAGNGAAAEDEVVKRVAATKKEPAPGEPDRRRSRATGEINKLVLQGHLIRDGRALRTSQVIEDSSDPF
jgi:hypothetical protein